MKCKDQLSKPTAVKTSIRTSEIILLEEHSMSPKISLLNRNSQKKEKVGGR